MQSSDVILVDNEDKEIGIEEKMKAHLDGKLHRAFSVLVFNSKGELLIQQRSKNKYHSAELWSNTVCSHPHPRQNILDEIHKRLKEEMGFDCPIRESFVFYYRKKFRNGLIENEIDHVFVGEYNGKVIPNPEEVSSFKWISIEELKEDLKKNPNKYTYWFKLIVRSL